MDTFEEVVELSSTLKLSKHSNPVAVIITQLTITTKVHSLLEGISNYFTKWNKHMMDTRDCQVSFTFGPCDYHQEVSLRVHLMEYITKQGFTIRNTRVHHMSERPTRTRSTTGLSAGWPGRQTTDLLLGGSWEADFQDVQEADLFFFFNLQCEIFFKYLYLFEGIGDQKEDLCQ